VIRRDLRVQFRLTQAEYARFAPLIKELALWNWSALVRAALKSFAEKHVPPASDNGVRQTTANKKERVPGGKRSRSAVARRGKKPHKSLVS
jgi:anti-sigma factor RsiW